MTADRNPAPLTIRPALGVAWIERGGDHMFIEPHEIQATVAALLSLLDAFEDAAA